VESPVVSSTAMRAAEKAAFARGVTAETLMNEAGAGIARAVVKFFPSPGKCVLFLGKGNNAGDALVAAQHLREIGWRIELRPAFDKRDHGELMRKKLEEFGAGQALPGGSPLHNRQLVVLDGLLGVGGKPPLRDPILSSCREINRLRREMNAFVFAVDLPTGLETDSGETDPDCVIADCTVTIGFAKRALVADKALNHVGRIQVVPLPDLTVDPAADATVASAASFRGILRRRDFGAYKNQFGRVGVVAGSRGLTGAAVLCASGALRGGAGLVNLFVTDDVYPIIAAIAPPEAMVRGVSDYSKLADQPVNVWAIGPGIGKEHAPQVREAIGRVKQPAVIDADGLNALADDPESLLKPPGPRLLTPHPGEMKRLWPSAPEERAVQAKQFVEKYPVTLLLKGSRTIVAERGRPISYNTTGTPAMASGGMGDVLTGVCAALIAQRLSLYDAARVGAWVCARAAEIALARGSASEESLIATDVIRNLGRAFSELRES
jgi:hydroxyethylthiazole kinase-like uncharacterized protein yjeF